MNSEDDDFLAALNNIAVARQGSHRNVLCTSMDVGPRLCHEAFPADWTSRRDYIQAGHKHNAPHTPPSLPLIVISRRGKEPRLQRHSESCQSTPALPSKARAVHRPRLVITVSS